MIVGIFVQNMQSLVNNRIQCGEGMFSAINESLVIS